jgi:hypothetical protein
MINNVVASKASESVDLDYFLPAYARGQGEKKVIDVNQDEAEMIARFG